MLNHQKRKIFFKTIYWLTGLTALGFSYLELAPEGHLGELPYGWIITILSFPLSIIGKILVQALAPHLWPQGMPAYHNYLVYIVFLIAGYLQWKILGPYLKRRWNQHKR